MGPKKNEMPRRSPKNEMPRRSPKNEMPRGSPRGSPKNEMPRGSPRGSPRLFFWLVVTIGGAAIGYYVQKWLKENDEHHVVRITVHRAVEMRGTLLQTSDRTLTIDRVPPVGTHRVANVLIGADANCKPSGTLTVDVANNVQLTLGACDLPSGTTGELVWTDSQTSSVGVDD